MNSKKERIRYKKLLENPSQKEVDSKSYHFTLFSANIKRFFPNVKRLEYMRLFKECLYNKWMSGVEQFDMEYLKENSIINESSINITSKNFSFPIIFTSFHLGSYRLFNAVLYELGYKVVIIIDDDVFQQQNKVLLNEVVPLLKKKKESDLIILNVKDRKSIFKLIQLIKEGYVMSVYLDGNTGISLNSQEFTKGYIPITFLNHNIYVKNGIGKLAAILSAMIIPTIAQRDKDGKNQITFHKEIMISSYKSKQEFAFKSISRVYELFEEILLRDPMQWTSWVSLHLWFKRDFETPYTTILYNKKEYKFNKERYSLFKVKDCDFIFDLIDYKAYPVDRKIYCQIKLGQISSINIDIKQQLRAKNIII